MLTLSSWIAAVVAPSTTADDTTTITRLRHASRAIPRPASRPKKTPRTTGAHTSAAVRRAGATELRWHGSNAPDRGPSGARGR